MIACYILAHGKVQATFDRHLPMWERYELPMVVCCPDDDPIQTDHERLFTGESSKNGKRAVVRLKNVLRDIISQQVDALLFEYDSLCKLDTIQSRTGFHGCIKITAPEHETQFVARRYATAPWMIDFESARRLLAVAEAYPDLTEGGHDDRYLSALATLAGVPVLSWLERCYTQNNILPHHHADVVGAKWIHGVKTEEAFKWIRKCP